MENLQNKAERIKKTYSDIWLGLDHVAAVGTGTTNDNQICIVISLEEDDESTRNIFPKEIEDIPVEFKITGKLEPE